MTNTNEKQARVEIKCVYSTKEKMTDLYIPRKEDRDYFSQKYIDRIYCTKEAEKALSDFDYLGEAVTLSDIEFMLAHPNIYKMYQFPVKMVRLNQRDCILYTGENLPEKVYLLGRCMHSHWRNCFDKKLHDVDYFNRIIGHGEHIHMVEF